MKIFLYLLSFLIFPGLVNSQFNYFDIVYPQSWPNGELSTNIFIRDSLYITFGGVATLEGDVLRFKAISPNGTLLSQHDTTISDLGVLWNTTDNMTHIDDGKFIWGSNFEVPNDNVSAQLWVFDENFAIEKTIELYHTNEDTNFVALHHSIQLQDGNYLSCGILGYDYYPPVIGVGSDDFEVFLIKTDSEGATIWETHTHYSTEEFLLASSIIEMPTGEILLSGSYGTGTNSDPIIIKFSEDGEFISELTWGYAFNDGAPILIALPDGNFSVFSNITLQEQPGPGVQVQRMIQLQSRCFNPITMSWVNDATVYPLSPLTGWLERASWGKGLIQENGEMALLVGWTTLNSESHMGIVKLGTTGDVGWFKEYSSSANTSFRLLIDLELALDGGYIATGFVYELPSFAQRHWLLKVDACGDTEPLGCEWLGVDSFDSSMEDTELQLWPNPNQGRFEISSGDVIESITLMDTSGSIIFFSKIETYHSTICPPGILPGIYFIELHMISGKRLTKKVVVTG